MQLLTASQMQEIDRNAIENLGIPGIDLMENAGRACAEVIIDRFGMGAQSALIFAGKGNNGGDGYVIARLLHQAGWNVKVIVLSEREAIIGDAAVNLARMPDEIPLLFCDSSERLDIPGVGIAAWGLIIDAVFGTGLKTAVTGVYRNAIELINASGIPVVSVDIPSGVHGTTGEILGCAVNAALTVTFAAGKLGTVLYPGAAQCGELMVVDIGIPAHLMRQAEGCEFIDSATAARMVVPRSPVAHKGSCGHALVVAGSTGHTGAAALAGASAVRSGAGLVTVAVPASLNQILEIKLTEAMTLPFDDQGRGYAGCCSLQQISAALGGKNAVAIGPGMSREPVTSGLIRSLVALIEQPLVLDADALNAVAEDLSVLMSRTPAAMIMTPHPGEMARLTGLSIKEIEADRVGTARSFAMKENVHLVLKGARTIIAAPDGRTAINGSGNPGMASGGMGDVLTGIITALLCQGYCPYAACCLGVFVHGFSADLVAAAKGTVGMTATDVIEQMPLAFKRLNDLQSGIQ